MKTNIIHNCDCLEGLRQIPDNSVDCCVTSPPYYGLRDYGVDGQIGLEETPEAFITRLVNVFREVRRVLKPEGTCWLNMGDSYSSSSMVPHGGNRSDRDQSAMSGIVRKPSGSLKTKDLIGIPWMLAFALRADGWYLRQDIIWAKPNPMPESVRDRCTKAHEYIFLLSKSPRYHFDAEAILEPCSPNTHMRISQDLAKQIGSYRANGGKKTNGPMKAVSRKTKQGIIGVVKNNSSFDQACCMPVEKRNKRSVWTVSTKPFKEAHFATYPQDIIVPCILAGCPEKGIVLDPFVGSGTTAIVAGKLNRQYIGYELNPEYIAIAERRIRNELGIFSQPNAMAL